MLATAQSFLDVEVPQCVQTISARDAILYALSVGYGSEPSDRAHLRFIHERDLVAAPTLANVVAQPGPWMQALGVNWDRVVHAEQRLVVHRPLPLGVPLVSRSRGLSIVDRGPQRGMFAAFERVLYRQGDPEPLAVIIHTNACLDDGGCGSVGDPPAPLPRPPVRPPDWIVEMAVPANAAALYRLNGDLNLLHIDPEAAARGGFPRPILHGLCTLGYAGYTISKAAGFDDLADLTAIAARFSAPVFPGDRLSFHIWVDGDEVQFRALAPDRGAAVLDFGTARLG